MSKIAIMTDSSANIDATEAKELDLVVIRMPIVIDDNEYTEEVDLNCDELIKQMREGKVAKTAQPIVGYLYAMWEETLKEYDHVIYIPISSGLSGSYQTAASLAKEFDGKVTVIDAKHVCYCLAKLCMQIKELINKGKSPLEIKNIVEKDSEMWAILVPGDLQYLKRGGRISSAAAALANLLKICPILKVENGAIDVYDKVRTLKKAYQVAVDAACDVDDADNYYFFILHADLEEEANKYAEIMSNKLGKPVTVRTIGTIVTCHTGPGTLGFGWERKIVK